MVDLRPAGDAGLHAMPLAVIGNLLGKSLHEFGPLRPRADQRHLSAQHIEKLGELIEPQPAKKFSHGRCSRIVLGCPHRASLRLGVRSHGTELVEQKWRAILADASLPVKNRAGRGQFYRQRNQQHDGQRHNRA